jgi:hypothetical protein
MLISIIATLATAAGLLVSVWCSRRAGQEYRYDLVFGAAVLVATMAALSWIRSRRR